MMPGNRQAEARARCQFLRLMIQPKDEASLIHSTRRQGGFFVDLSMQKENET